jgi:hypothetical protein
MLLDVHVSEGATFATPVREVCCWLLVRLPSSCCWHKIVNGTGCISCRPDVGHRLLQRHVF